MTWVRRRWLPLLVLILAVAGLAGSMALVATHQTVASMMGVISSGRAPVRSLAEARTAANGFGARWGLHAGEVIEFDNGFYAELLDPAGNGATEVLIDPASGTVGVEYGPAMMWNTAYGMIRNGYPMMRPYRASTVIGADQARQLAQQWLTANRPGQQAETAEAFPGYYTIDIAVAGRISGMLSVHATTGQVWYHSWHGRFIAQQDAA
jgi:hypothetical protein